MEQLAPDPWRRPGRVGKLKKGDGGPILVAGSATRVHSLIENDLVDEQTFGSGVAVHTYELA